MEFFSEWRSHPVLTTMIWWKFISSHSGTGCAIWWCSRIAYYTTHRPVPTVFCWHIVRMNQLNVAQWVPISFGASSWETLSKNKHFPCNDVIGQSSCHGGWWKGGLGGWYLSSGSRWPFESSVSVLSALFSSWRTLIDWRIWAASAFFAGEILQRTMGVARIFIRDGANDHKVFLTTSNKKHA